MNDDVESRTIQSVATAARLINCLREREGSTVTQLTEDIDRSPASVHSHLATLKQAGLVVQNKDTYDLGPQFLTLGEYVRNHSNLYQAAEDQVEKLASESGECAHLIIEHDGKLFALYERFGAEAVGIEYHNRKREEALNHLHCTAAGKCILAGLPEDRVNRLLDQRGMPQNTPNTISDRGTLFEELADVRESGYAFADEEQMEGIRAVGAPVYGPQEDVEGAIAISGPISRLQGDQFRTELPRSVTQATNVCEINLRTTNIE